MRPQTAVFIAFTLGLVGCGSPHAELLLLPITNPDSGRGDAGNGVDAGTDAGSDAGRDAGPDAGPDGGPDGGPGCNLEASPDSIDFGKVFTGNTGTATVTLFNDGGATCHAVLPVFSFDSDPAFSIPDTTEPTDLAPGAEAIVTVTFAPGPAILPLFRTATLDLQTSEPVQADAGVFLSASVSADCAKTSQVIFTFDESANLSSFDPNTLTFSLIGYLNCPGSSGPFSMSVDENGVAWVLYWDGNIYQVDTGTGACYATSYVSAQQGFLVFGMGDVFHSPTNTDELFIAGNAFNSQQSLGTLDFATLQVSSVGTLAVNNCELAGTGDGELWCFSPEPNWPNLGTPVLAQIDWATGNALQTLQLDTLPTDNCAWAMKYFGGSFWIFVCNQVFAIDRTTLTVTQPVPYTAWPQVVGAGISTCATLQ